MLRSLAVLDIDGVVADATHRLHHLARPQPNHADWVRFFAAADDDPVLTEGAELARRLGAEHDLAWVTGRPERIRSLTRTWLRAHGLPEGQLFMQPEGDRRPARQVKLEHVRQLAEHQQITVIFDDDPRVVRLYEAAGLPVQLANWLPWSPAKRP